MFSLIKKNRVVRRLLLPSVERVRASRYIASLERRALPPILHIEPTAACNLKCVMCFRNRNQFPVALMDFALYERLIEQAAAHRVQTLRLYFRGEPLLHPRITDMVALARVKGIPDIQINTNAQLLTLALSDNILRAGLTTLYVSAEGYAKDTYESIRRGASFETLLKNIDAFHEARSGLKENTTRLVLITVNMKKNPLPDPEFDRFWRRRVDGIMVVNMVGHKGLDARDLRIREPQQAAIAKPCLQLWDRMVVTVDGTVSMCCIDILAGHTPGSAMIKPLSEIWRGDMMKKIRETHKKGKRADIPMCAACTYMD